MYERKVDFVKSDADGLAVEISEKAAGRSVLGFPYL
jgi:hypothetical protein